MYAISTGAQQHTCASHQSYKLQRYPLCGLCGRLFMAGPCWVHWQVYRYDFLLTWMLPGPASCRGCQPTGGWVCGTESPYAWLLGIGVFVSGTTHLLSMEAPGADRLGRGFQNSVCWHQYPHGKTSSPKLCCQPLCPQKEFPLLLALLEGSPRSASGSGPGFQITSSVMRLRVCKIVCVPFKSSISFPVALHLSHKQSPAGFQ